jgi:hypothetical protein
MIQGYFQRGRNKMLEFMCGVTSLHACRYERKMYLYMHAAGIQGEHESMKELRLTNKKW